MSSFLSVVVVDNERVDETTQGSTHPQWAEHECPHNLGENVASTRHDEYTDSKEDNFDRKTAEPEEEKRTQIDDTPFMRCFVVIRRGNNRLILNHGEVTLRIDACASTEMAKGN